MKGASRERLPWVLPGLTIAGDEDRAWHEGTTAAGASFRTPALTEDEARTVLQDVREAVERVRRERSLEEVVQAAGRAASELGDPATQPGQEAGLVLEEELAWPGPLVAETLQGMAAGWNPRALQRLLREELDEPGVLDGFLEADGHGEMRRFRRAVGPPVILQIQSGNVPGVGVTGILRALLVRSGVLVKSAREEPGLAASFVRNLHRHDSLLARTVAVTWWPGEEDPPARRVWSAEAGLVVVYGGREAVAGLRRSLSASTDLVAYGPKLGAGVVLRDADLHEAARSMARDVCAYEQRGCVSPRLIFVLPGQRRVPFAEALHEALRDEVEERGRAPLSPATASAIRALRAEIDLGARGEDARFLGDPDELGWTVLTGSRPWIESEPLPRIVRVFGAADPAGVGQELAMLKDRIQAVGYAGEEELDELADVAAHLGACRVAPFGTVAWPPADWRHDGRHQLLPLLRWTELESPR